MWALYPDEESDFPKFHLWEQLGWQGVRAVMDALKQVKYSHTKSIRLWKTMCEDEGVRALCEYVNIAPNVLLIELLDNSITKLGCEFISRILSPKSASNVMYLKLDHNSFGSEGVANLAKGLCQNSTLQNLSMTYCNIDEAGARPLFEIVIYQKSALEELNLSGNHLRDSGTIELLKGVSVSKSLKKLIISDNQFFETDEVLDAIEKCFKRNKTLGNYDFKHNFISDDGVLRIADILEVASHVGKVEISERISKETLEIF